MRQVSNAETTFGFIAYLPTRQKNCVCIYLYVAWRGMALRCLCSRVLECFACGHVRMCAYMHAVTPTGPKALSRC